MIIGVIQRMILLITFLSVLAFLEGRGDAALIIPNLATELNILDNWQRTRQKYDADMLAVSKTSFNGKY